MCVWHDPDLKKMHRLVGMVPLRVLKSCAGGHPLDVILPDEIYITHGILVFHLAFKDDGDNFHFFVGMYSEALVWLDNIIVEDPEHSVVCVCRIMVIAEGKQPVCLQPPCIGKVSFICWYYVYHGITYAVN
jgi:hypothetical protein